MHEFKAHQVLMLFYAVIALCFTGAYGGVRPKTATTFYVTEGKEVAIPCWIGQNTGAMWFYQFENLRGRDESFMSGEYIILKIRDVRLTDTGSYQCVSNGERSLVRLIVTDLGEPAVVRARPTNATQLKISWAAPRSTTDAVAGYKLYATQNVGSFQKTKEYRIDKASKTKKESIVLNDMAPGAEYEIKLSAFYFDGADGKNRIEGPVTPAKIVSLPDLPAQENDTSAVEESGSSNHSTPSPDSDKILISFMIPKPSKSEPDKTDINEMLKPVNLVVVPDGDSRLVVSWQLQVLPRPRQLLGYNVAFQPVKKRGKKKKLPASGEMNATQPVGQTSKASNWRVVITRLKPRFQYVVTVSPILPTGFGSSGTPVTVLLAGVEQAARQLSIRAVALAPDSVLVTFKIQGKGKLSKIKLFYIEDGETEWQKSRVKLKDDKKIIKGLKPKTRYFFYATTKMAKLKKEAVTHVVTPPSGLSKPTDLLLTPGDRANVYVEWSHQDDLKVIDYRLTVEERQQDGAYRIHQDTIADLETKSGEINNLHRNNDYRVKVTPYDFDGAGEALEMLFHVAADGSIDNSVDTITSPPEFETELPKQINITKGQRLDLSCGASGTPTPEVSWYVNNAAERTGAAGIGHQTLVIDPVDGPLGVVCVANNSAGAIFAPVRVTILVEPEAETSKPEFVMDIPSHQEVRKGGTLLIDCEARGSPTPDVLWYVNSELTGAPVMGSSKLIISPVDGPLSVLCVANNSAGTIFAPIRVSVVEKPSEDPREPLQFTSDIPEMMSVTSGGNVTIQCSAAGSPKPHIRWYKNGELKAQAGPNDPFALFHEIDITANFSATCVVSNDMHLISAKVDIISQEPESISVEAYIVPVSGSKVLVRWIVTQGDLDAIRGFNAAVYDQFGKELVVVPLARDQRSLPLDNFNPNASFKLVLKTLTSEGVADEDILDIVFQTPDPGQETKLHVDIVEVRENQARLNIRVTGPDANLVESYRINVSLLTPYQTEQIIKIDEIEYSSLVMEELESHRQYELIISALSKDSVTLLKKTLKFRTSLSGRSGSQVLSGLTLDEITGQEGKTCPQCPVCTTPPIPTCGCVDQTNSTIVSSDSTTVSNDITRAATEARTAPDATGSPADVSSLASDASSSESITTLKTDLSSRPIMTLEPDVSSLTPMVTTLKSESSSLTPVVTTLEPEVSSLSSVLTTHELDTTFLPVSGTTSSMTPETTDSQKFVLTSRVLTKTSSGIRFAWVVEQGDLNKVHSFLFKFSTRSGRKLVEAKVRSKARTLNLTSLRPKSAYIINIKARGIDGEVLAEAELPVTTSSKDALKGPSKPKLYLEANEVRNGQLRLFWGIQDGGNLKVSSFRMRVLNGDFGDSELLTRKMPPNRASFLFQRIPPKRHISIIMDAMGKDNQPLLTSGLTVDTPASGTPGKPAIGSPLVS